MRQTQAQLERSGRRLVVTGAVLEATAVVLGIAGLVTWTIAATSRAQQRVARMEVPPSELARRHGPGREPRPPPAPAPGAACRSPGRPRVSENRRL
jgi:hypothetical protein